MWQVVGHDWVVALLKKCIADRRVSHAYLFTGPGHVGKRTLAVNMAQALNCEDQDRPCGRCVPCRKIRDGVHPDARMVDSRYQAQMLDEPLAQQRVLRIDTIRAIEGDVSLKPFEGLKKVFIIPDAETMTTEAANCLLKTLEEPPTHAVLILTASDPRLLLPTIVSRCQVFGLRPVPVEMIERELRSRYDVDEERATLLARLSGGSIGWAITAAQDGAVMVQRGERLKELIALPKMTRTERLDYAESLSRQLRSIGQVMELWLGWWRDLLLVRSGCAEMVSNVDLRAVLEEQGGRHDLREICGFIGSIRQTVRQLDQNANARLALEVLVLDLPAGNN